MLLYRHRDHNVTYLLYMNIQYISINFLGRLYRGDCEPLTNTMIDMIGLGFVLKLNRLS